MKNSEPIFADYLTENWFNWKYELPIGGSNPDFSVWQDEATPIAFWDVADRSASGEDQAEIARIIELSEKRLPGEVGGGPTKGYRFVRAKIKGKFRQFEKAAPIPGMLVLVDWLGRARVDPAMMAAAIYGWPVMKLRLGCLEEVPTFGRAPDGKMVEEGIAEGNRHIAAIGILQYRPINYYVHGLHRFEQDVLNTFDDLNHAVGLIGRETRRQCLMGIDLDMNLPVLDIYLTKDAHHEWPLAFAGKHDGVYAYDDRSANYCLVRDGLVPSEPLPVPASEDQKTIWAIKALPGLRNE